MFIRWCLAVLTGVVVAATAGGLAWFLSPVAPGLSGVVFAATTLPIGLTLGWVIAVAPKTVPASPHATDSVENAWLNKALAGTATDVVIVVGLSLAAVSITRIELPTQLVLLTLLLVAIASTVARYASIRVRAVRA